MATITELENAVPGKFGFLRYIWTVFTYLLRMVTKSFRLSVKKAFVITEHTQHENLTNMEKQDQSCQTSIERCYHGNKYRRHNGNKIYVTSIKDVLKVLGRHFKEVYAGFYEPPQTASSSSFNHVIVLNLFQSPKRATFKPHPKYDEIMAKLTWLEDNGDFDEFDRYSSKQHDRYKNESPDITVAILVEQSRCMLYRDQLPQAKFLARTSLELATSTACPGLYIARACLLLSACYRKKGKLGKAKAFLNKAWQNLATIDNNEDWCRYYDAYGSYLNGISDTMTLPGLKVLEDAKECFSKQLEAAGRETKKTLYSQRFHALLKMARTLLDANTIFGQQRDVPDSDVTKAGEYLDKIETELLENVARGPQVQFMIIRVKQYYRQQRFREAASLLKESIDMAEIVGCGQDRALMAHGLKMLTLKAGQQNSKISSAEGTGDRESSDGRRERETLESASDSVGVFDSD
ncbi:uncharacterized protein LOC114525151 [Dendronephthya gigantea]|uniref:uncharacterized protein LOC114525151 n=1 Tax=Dendronephthya gigantea TaxID=151771 RepID=UPI00106C3AD1|nr:uncharacterized protein LOC114525151 [Dendronephthya gigantea]